MLYLKNSKGGAANSLVRDIFVTDLLNRASCLFSLLSALRASGATSAHFIKTGEVALELLMAAEGLEVSVETSDPEASSALLEKHFVRHLLREAPLKSADVLLFDSVNELNHFILQEENQSKLKEAKLILVFDLKWNNADVQLLSSTLVTERNFKMKCSYFGFFSRLSKKGKFSLWMSRIDQSILKHLIPSSLKSGIYIEITHG